MKGVIFVTGNPGKAKYFSELIGMPIEHHAAEVDEIQSLDLEEIVTLKAKQAYEQLKRPVIIEDTGLIINSMGKLPGPFIKWFLEEVGLEKICRLADMSPDRSAVAGSVYTYYDGEMMKQFKGSLDGSISEHPRGDGGFGWNSIFIPHYANQTLGEMDGKTFKEAYVQIKSIFKLKEFLESIDKK